MHQENCRRQRCQAAETAAAIAQQDRDAKRAVYHGEVLLAIAIEICHR